MSLESALVAMSAHEAVLGHRFASPMANGTAGDDGMEQAADESDSNRPPPSHTPGKAEGEDGDVEGDQGDEGSHDPVRRKRPSQAEGEDPADDAGDAPRED